MTTLYSAVANYGDERLTMQTNSLELAIKIVNQLYEWKPDKLLIEVWPRTPFVEPSIHDYASFQRLFGAT